MVSKQYCLLQEFQRQITAQHNLLPWQAYPNLDNLFNLMFKSVNFPSVCQLLGVYSHLKSFGPLVWSEPKADFIFHFVRFAFRLYFCIQNIIYKWSHVGDDDYCSHWTNGGGRTEHRPGKNDSAIYTTARPSRVSRAAHSKADLRWYISKFGTVQQMRAAARSRRDVLHAPTHKGLLFVA